MKQDRNYVQDILFGVAVGDALGVPVEFQSRESLRQNPVLEMRGFGSHHQPVGTWSDDSSLTFCLAEALTKEFSLQTIADNFVLWLSKDYWTPRGHVFDIGMATRQAILRLHKGERPDLAGGFDISSNGNGSLMRILPLVLHIQDKTLEERYHLTKLVSSITHGHIRSVIACFYYLEFARLLIKGVNKWDSYIQLKSVIPVYLRQLEINPEEIKLFDRLLREDIFLLPEEEIYSSGYVLHTLEASVWSLLTTSHYKEAVLKAVNLGEDTDTTGAVTGGLAGLAYGHETIPKNWIDQLARKEDIKELGRKWKLCLELF
jgi:ADP-ribosylglycohydrolase